jgi:hypothetical protein
MSRPVFEVLTACVRGRVGVLVEVGPGAFALRRASPDGASQG